MNISTNITIFGGTGDLTFRKLLPALYTMFLAGKLPAGSRIVAVGRRDYSDGAYRVLAEDWVKRFSRLPYTEERFADFAQRLVYFRMDLSNQTDYGRLDAFFAQDTVKNHLFYLAVAPRYFAVITEGLKRVRGARAGKVMLEKPFGESLDAARTLNEELEGYFGPERIYRIDHYLGKEMVRNIQAIRFANPIFTDVWNARSIEAVQISALEEVGVETRGGYYDASGALKDMVQNHLFQILSIVAMERPGELSSAQMHTGQLDVLRALRPPEEYDICDTLVLRCGFLSTTSAGGARPFRSARERRPACGRWRSPSCSGRPGPEWSPTSSSSKSSPLRAYTSSSTSSDPGIPTTSSPPRWTSARTAISFTSSTPPRPMSGSSPPVSPASGSGSHSGTR